MAAIITTTTITTISIASVREALHHKVEAARQEVMEAIRTQRIQLSQQINSERQQRLSFEQDARAGIAIKLASVEDEFKQRVSELEGLFIAFAPVRACVRMCVCARVCACVWRYTAPVHFLPLHS